MSDQIPSNMFHNDKGMPLSELVAASSTWESAIVPIGSSFRRGLAAATALSAVAAAAGAFLLDGYNTAADKPGLFLGGWEWFVDLIHLVRSLVPLYLAVVALLVAALVLTEGFAVAGRRMQVGLAAVAASGTVGVLPGAVALLIVAANVALFAIGAALVIAFFIGMFIVFLESL